MLWGAEARDLSASKLLKRGLDLKLLLRTVPAVVRRRGAN
jgi:hypothetical protein